MSYFTLDEFRCKCGNCENKINSGFVALMEEIREEFGEPLRVNSGYRCAEHDKAVGGVGPHTTGFAGDFAPLSGWTPAKKYKLVGIALACGATGVGVADTFVHIDRIPQSEKRWPRPALWTYPKRG